MLVSLFQLQINITLTPLIGVKVFDHCIKVNYAENKNWTPYNYK